MNPEGNYRCSYLWQAAVKGASELLWMLRVHILSYPPLERTMGQLALLGFHRNLREPFRRIFLCICAFVCVHACARVCMHECARAHACTGVHVLREIQRSTSSVLSLLLFFSQVRISLMSWSVSVCSVSIWSVSVWL